MLLYTEHNSPAEFGGDLIKFVFCLNHYEEGSFCEVSKVVWMVDWWTVDVRSSKLSTYGTEVCTYYQRMVF